MEEQAKHATAGGDSAGQQAPPTRVLVVEEDRVEGGMLAFHLRREGLVVMLAASGDEAIDALAWAPPDALMVEAHGRELDGFEVIRALGDAAVRVFLLADGPLDLEDDLEALRLGVSDVFTKPVDPAVVARRVIERRTPATRGSIADLPDAGLSGDLEVHPVTHLLSLCHRHRMNARLHVELDGDWGVLLIRHGDVIDAESPGATGREAAFAAIRRAHGTFVLFPLSLDAEELSRDDVVRADVATLFTEALGRPLTRQVKSLRSTEHVIEIKLPARESPRGPLSRPAVRRPDTISNETLEYQATPHESDQPRPSPDTETRARIQRQVGIPADRPADRPAADRAQTKTAPEVAAAPPPVAELRVAAPPEAEVEVEAETHGHSRADNNPRRRVTTGAQVRERAGQIRRPTRPMPVSSPPMEPVRPQQALAAASTPPERPRRPTTRPPVAPADGGPPLATLPKERGGWAPAARATTSAAAAPADATETVVGHAGVAALTASGYEALPVGEFETVPAGYRPPELPASARVVRPTAVDRSGAEPGLDEPTEVNEKNPITEGPRVRRPSTGMYRIGDANTPRERTDVDVVAAAPPDESVMAPRPGVRLPHWSVLAAAALLVLLLVFVVVKVATNDAAPAAPGPPAATLGDATQARIHFGEAATALRLGENDKAQRLFEALVGDAARPDGALAGLAMMYLREGKLEDAEPVLEVLNRQRRDDPRVLSWLGILHTRQGRMDEAHIRFLAARKSASGALADRLDELLKTFE